MSKSLRELLNPVKTQVRKTHANSAYDPYPVNPNTRGTDGEDHINISPYAATELGRAISNEVAVDVRHKIFGKFRSVTGFWYYIKSKERDDRCRQLIAKGLKDFTKGLTLSEVKNFRAIILDTVWMKVEQYPAIREALRESTLPFECYFEDRNTGLRQRPNYFSWFLDGMNEIRLAIQEDRLPDLERFLDDKSSGIYDFVLPPKPTNPAPAKKKPKNSLTAVKVLHPVDEYGEVNGNVAEPVQASDENSVEETVVPAEAEVVADQQEEVPAV